MIQLDDRVIEFSEYLADEARNVVLPHYRNQFIVEDKADSSPVTEVDKAVENVIRKLVENNYPEHGVIGEEYGPVRENAEYVWVVDPIDGTKSFITGRPLFGTLISLVYKGVPVLGLIDQPVLRERWLGANGVTKFNTHKVYTRNCPEIEKAYFATTSPFLFNYNDIPKIERVTKAVKTTTYGGDCYSYAQLAMGLIDVVIESGLKTYDFAALVPVIENAGGKITDWSGNPIDINSNGKILACGDPVLHAKLLDWLS